MNALRCLAVCTSLACSCIAQTERPHTDASLPYPATTLSDRSSGWNAIVEGPGEDAAAEIAWHHRSESEAVSGSELVTDIVNRSGRRRCVAVEYRFDLPNADYDPLIAGVNPTPAWPDDGDLAYAYVRESSAWVRMAMPYFELTSRERDAGMSIAADLVDHPILSFEVRMRRVGDGTVAVVRRNQVRLEPNGKNRIILFVGKHGGDYREGLGWMRAEWPTLFTVC